jgi:hypothetical protein
MNNENSDKVLFERHKMRMNGLLQIIFCKQSVGLQLGESTLVFVIM